MVGILAADFGTMGLLVRCGAYECNGWWSEWNEYAGLERINEHVTFEHSNQFPFDSPCRPGKIDNSELVEEGSDLNERHDGLTLKKNLQELHEYHLVPLDDWKKLLE